MRLDEKYRSAVPELKWTLSADDFAALAVVAFAPKEIPTVGLDHLHAPLISIREQAAIVVTLLRSAGTLNFRDLVAGVTETGVVVARFLAILELYRHAALSFEQLEPLGELTCAGPPRGGRKRTSPPWEPTMTDDPVIDTAPAQAPIPAQRPSDTASVARRLEAILLILDEPQSLVSLSAAVGAPVPAVRQAVETLVADYDGRTGGPVRGFELREVGGGWRLYVREEYDDVVGEFVNTQAPSRLSQAALETLAVIAYKQPVTRGQVASIRAVNVDSVVRTLLARGLITEVFTDPDTGAIHYGTTDQLLVNLGINSLDELPHISPLLDDGSDGFDGEVLK